MRGITHKWSFRDGSNFDLDGASDSSPLHRRVLAARGIAGDETAQLFCEPRLTALHDPSLLPGVDRAASRLLDALRNRERIVIYGDYDVDGITATAAVYRLLKAIDSDADIDTYVPHRLDEGYGLNDDAIRQLHASGATVVVSVDCGIRAHAPARVARELGVDLIVTDHHNPPETDDELPPAYAIVHPGLPGSAYPCRDLCGAGVAFKLAWRVATMWNGSDRLGSRLRAELLQLVPLAALGTIADVVPLTDENRILAAIGLSMMSRSTIQGVQSLIDATGLREKAIDTERVGFILAPHLNASGRMEHAKAALHLLISDDAVECDSIAARLVTLNRERQRIQRQIEDHAAQRAEDAGMTVDDRPIIVLADESWHRGVVGIVCSRLTETFCRPSVLLQHDGDMCYGSARSIDGYSIADALSTCAELLDTHGGHDMAAGLSLRADRLDALVARLTAHAREHIAIEQLTPTLRVDCVADLDELHFDSVRDLGRLAPYGRGNPKPVVAVRNVRIAGSPRQIGSEGRHLSAQICVEGNGRRQMMRVVWWNGARHADALASGMRIDLAIEPKLNTWNSRTQVEGVVRDVHIRHMSGQDHRPQPTPACHER